MEKLLEFHLRIERENDTTQSPEDLARLLRYVSWQLENGTEKGPIRDHNGNNIGFFGPFETLLD